MPTLQERHSSTSPKGQLCVTKQTHTRRRDVLRAPPHLQTETLVRPRSALPQPSLLHCPHPLLMGGARRQGYREVRPGYSWMCHGQEELRLQLCDHLRVQEGFWENPLTKTRPKLSPGHSSPRLPQLPGLRHKPPRHGGEYKTFTTFMGSEGGGWDRAQRGDGASRSGTTTGRLGLGLGVPTLVGGAGCPLCPLFLLTWSLHRGEFGLPHSMAAGLEGKCAMSENQAEATVHFPVHLQKSH